MKERKKFTNHTCSEQASSSFSIPRVLLWEKEKHDFLLSAVVTNEEDSTAYLNDALQKLENTHD